MDVDDLEIESFFENYYMDGPIHLENDDMDNDYIGIELRWETYYMDGRILL